MFLLQCPNTRSRPNSQSMIVCICNKTTPPRPCPHTYSLVCLPHWCPCSRPAPVSSQPQPLMPNRHLPKLYTKS
ncbi:hypothetical protein BC628DRAFT_164079 [Trametes gibbosa]|nr:hypothetical protein BC628DRAFT_164079 [Trametes gibbosa]